MEGSGRRWSGLISYHDLEQQLEVEGSDCRWRDVIAGRGKPRDLGQATLCLLRTGSCLASLILLEQQSGYIRLIQASIWPIQDLFGQRLGFSCLAWAVIILAQLRWDLRCRCNAGSLSG